ncbi:hypothetical protein RRG08_043286 [Elysia crispata]|uniref:Uncharacterized protein n=1 Tax=Elysia crispata TaxID=231223 RepID=A0AAE1CPI2_9GAST|nr:hypothetical protein RRG08_043286 [Elysia crispata]
MLSDAVFHFHYSVSLIPPNSTILFKYSLISSVWSYRSAGDACAMRHPAKVKMVTSPPFQHCRHRLIAGSKALSDKVQSVTATPPSRSRQSEKIELSTSGKVKMKPCKFKEGPLLRRERRGSGMGNAKAQRSPFIEDLPGFALGR